MKMISKMSIFLWALSWAISSSAYELIFIQVVSDTKKTFVTRHGKEHDIQYGMDFSFSTPRISLLARATTITRNFTHWKVLEPHAKVPFVKGQIVVMNPAPEHVNLYDKIQYLKDYQKYKDDSEQKTKDSKVHAINLGGSFGKGISQTVSNTDPLFNTRQMTQITALYHYALLPSRLYVGGGVRVDQELAETPTVTTESTRVLALLDLEAHLLLSDVKQVYFVAGTSIGIGSGQTSIVDETSTGVHTLFPSVRGGLEVYMKKGHFAFQVGAGFDAISSEERFEDNEKQTSNYTNWNAFLTLKKYF